MAQKVTVVLVDDIDGGEAHETVSFSLDNVGYEIDLSSDNAAKLRDALSPWLGKARRVSSRRGGTRARRSDSAKVRAWAKENGFEVSERGRMSAEVREAYANAH